MNDDWAKNAVKSMIWVITKSQIFKYLDSKVEKAML